VAIEDPVAGMLHHHRRGPSIDVRSGRQRDPRSTHDRQHGLEQRLPERLQLGIARVVARTGLV
jgi:hypothetical protein